MLLKGCLRSFLEQSVNALVQIVRGHEVVDYAESGDVYSAFVAAVDVVSGFGKFALLLDYFDRFATRSAFTGSNTLLFAISRCFARSFHLRRPLLIKDRIFAASNRWFEFQRQALAGFELWDDRSKALE